MTAQPAVPVRVRCLPSQPPLQSGCCEYSPVSRGRDVSGADSLSAVIKFTRANTTTRSVGRPSSRSAVDTAKQTVFSVAFWRNRDRFRLGQRGVQPPGHRSAARRGFELAANHLFDK